MTYNYNDIQGAILKRNIELLVEYKHELYWITINNRSSCFGDRNGNISLVFSTPEELLKSALIDNKTLMEIWADVEVVSYESGWGKTINRSTTNKLVR